MIDALEPALERLPLGLSEAATAAREVQIEPLKLVALKLGELATSLKNNFIGNNDPGAEAVALLFEHLASE